MDEVIVPIAPPARGGRPRKDIVSREHLEKIAEAAWLVLEADLARRKKYRNAPPRPGDPMHDLARAFKSSAPHLIDVTEDGAWLK